MSHLPAASIDAFRLEIAAFLAGRGHATGPEIRRHLCRSHRELAPETVRRYASASLQCDRFEVSRSAHRGPVTLHVRLAAPRRRLRRTRRAR